MAGRGGFCSRGAGSTHQTVAVQGSRDPPTPRVVHFGKNLHLGPMHYFRFGALPLALGALCANSAPAQVYTRPDSARIANAIDAGALVVHWIETTTSRTEQAVYLRNTANEPVQVQSYEIFDCQNLRGNVCGVHAPGPVIQPGKTVELVVVSQSYQYAAWSFKYRFNVIFLRPSPATGNAATSLAPCPTPCIVDAPMHVDSMGPQPGSVVTADSVFRATTAMQAPRSPRSSAGP